MAQKIVIIFWSSIIILETLVVASPVQLKKSIAHRAKRSFEDRFSFPSDDRNSQNRDVSNKPNSYFNRLAGRVSVHDNIQDYDENDVKPDNYNGATSSYSGYVYDSNGNIITSTESGLYQNEESATSRRRHRYKPCVPVPVGYGYGRDANRNGKTFIDYNVNYFDYNVNAPVNVEGGGSGVYHEPQYQPTQQVQVQSHPYPQHHQKPQYPVQPFNGGYACIPNYYGGHQQHGHKPHRPHRPFRPQGGPLGFFGQGGLFDLNGANSGGQTGDSTGPSNVESEAPVGDDERPVYEFNVSDTIQTVVRTDTWTHIYKNAYIII